MIQDIAPHKYDVTYRNVNVEDDDIMLIFRDNCLLCHISEGDIEYPKVQDIEKVFAKTKQKAKFMFRIDDNDYFELRKPEIEPFGKWEYVSKDKVRAMRPVWKAFVAITGFQIHDWYTNNKYCGKCGAEMEPTGDERAMGCPSCKRVVYPQICPSVIVGVIDGEKLLLTKYASSHSKFKKYALIAGYAEVGESLEDTVHREVKEEVGLKVKNIRYYASQPWSFTDTLLVGFFCDIDGSTDITLDTNELSVGEWMRREEIPDESADSTISLTGTMMKAFKEGQIK